MAEEEQNRRPRNPAPLQPLDYFTINGPEDQGRRRVIWGFTFLIAGMLPLGCGIVSAMAPARSGLRDVIKVHLLAGRVLVVMALALSGLGIVMFVRARDWMGVGIASAIALMEAAVGVCVGGYF